MNILRWLLDHLFSEISYRINVDKSVGEPLLAEEALVHAKTEGRNCWIIHFYIADRDSVVNCDVPYEIWRYLNKGQRGILCHQGGDFYSFESENILHCENMLYNTQA